jgi:hypothetical protein
MPTQPNQLKLATKPPQWATLSQQQKQLLLNQLSQLIRQQLLSQQPAPATKEETDESLP